MNQHIQRYLLTPWCRVLLEKLTGLQLVKKFPAFYGNPKVHYRTHKRPPPVPILGQPNQVHIPTSHLLEIHPNIIHPSTPRSPPVVSSPPVSPPRPYTSPSPHPFAPHAQPISFFSILSPTQYWVRNIYNVTYCNWRMTCSSDYYFEWIRFKKKSPSREAYNRQAGQDKPFPLWNLELLKNVHTRPPPGLDVLRSHLHVLGLASGLFS